MDFLLSFIYFGSSFIDIHAYFFSLSICFRFFNFLRMINYCDAKFHKLWTVLCEQISDELRSFYYSRKLNSRISLPEYEMSVLNQMSWLVKTASIELRVTSLNRQRSHTQRLLHLLLDDMPVRPYSGECVHVVICSLALLTGPCGGTRHSLMLGV